MGEFFFFVLRVFGDVVVIGCGVDVFLVCF